MKNLKQYPIFSPNISIEQTISHTIFLSSFVGNTIPDTIFLPPLRAIQNPKQYLTSGKIQNNIQYFLKRAIQYQIQYSHNTIPNNIDNFSIRIRD